RRIGRIAVLAQGVLQRVPEERRAPRVPPCLARERPAELRREACRIAQHVERPQPERHREACQYAHQNGRRCGPARPRPPDRQVVPSTATAARTENPRIAATLTPAIPNTAASKTK